MTPLELSMELAKRQLATLLMSRALLQCALVMRSWPDMDEAMDHLLRGAGEVARAPIVPDGQGDAQLHLLTQLRDAVLCPTGPDWDQVQVHARKLVELLQSDCAGLPGEDSKILDIFEGQRALEAQDD